MGRHANKKPRTTARAVRATRVAPADDGKTGESSFYDIVSAGAQDGALWVRNRVKRMVVTVLSVLLAVILCGCGVFYWWDTQGKAKRARVEAENSCVQQVGRMTESYNKAFRLYNQVTSKFSELDESYDLDALSALQGRKPEGYETLRCSTDLDGDVKKAKALERSYDELAGEYRRALVPVQK